MTCGINPYVSGYMGGSRKYVSRHTELRVVAQLDSQTARLGSHTDSSGGAIRASAATRRLRPAPARGLSSCRAVGSCQAQIARLFAPRGRSPGVLARFGVGVSAPEKGQVARGERPDLQTPPSRLPRGAGGARSPRGDPQ